MGKLKKMWLLLLLLLVVSVTGCGTASSEETKKTNGTETKVNDTGEKKVVRIGGPGADGALNMELGNLAIGGGYIEEELNKIGYTSEVSGLGTGGQVNEALAGDLLDIVIYGDLPVITGISGGLDLTLIGAANQSQQFGIIATDPEITDVEGLVGKKVIVPIGTNVQYVWNKYLKEKGLSIDDFEIINAAADATSLLQTGDADAYVSSISYVNMFSAIGMGNVISLRDVPEASSQFFVVGVTSYLNDHPEVGVAIEKAMIRAQKATIENPQVLYDATASENLSADFTKTMYDFDNSFSFLSPEITQDSISKLKQLEIFMLENNLITDEVDIDSIIDTSYYEQAIAE